MSKESGGKKSPSAQRVRRLREHLGYTRAKDFARLLGISEKRWNNVENGYPISRDVATLICRKIPGMTIDYLYNGSLLGLPFALSQALSEPPSKELSPPQKSPSR